MTVNAEQTQLAIEGITCAELQTHQNDYCFTLVIDEKITSAARVTPVSC
jgi:hypothetical protein